MRGALSVSAHLNFGDRIIPADAGSTIEYRPGFCFKRDHPRGCGEHMGYRLIRVSGLGSSPRMRGAPNGTCGVGLLAGIIPADAGSTWESLNSREKDEDHPRGCGEHLSRAEVVVACSGSSPRMRGALFLHLFLTFFRGIIPADAGST